MNQKPLLIGGLTATILAVTAQRAFAFCTWWMEPCECVVWWIC